MAALYLLVPFSALLLALAAWIVFGAAESGQFEDLDGPGILMDDDNGSVVAALAEHPGVERAAG